MFRIRRATLRRRTLSSLFAVLSIFFLLGTGYAKDRVPRNLLILHSYHPSLSWTNAVMKGMQEVLVQSGEPVQLHVDYLDARRYSGAEYRQKTEALLLHKLAKERFDLVLLSDNDALDFYLENCKRIAPEVPVIFCGINNFNPTALSGRGKITGIAEEVSLQETIDTALKLHLGTKEIIVIGRTSLPADRANREAFRSLVQSGPQSVKFIFWDDLSAKELRRRLPSLESGSLVFINGLTQEETGRQLVYDETTRLIREASKVPLYSLWDVYLGYGIVGGKLVSGYMQGKLAGELAVRVLRGEDPDKMPVIRKEGANRFMFDYRELTRFGLSVSSVPAGSEIVNSPSSFYMVNKGYLWGGVVSLLIFALIILLLGINIFARRRAEGALRESETKYRLLHETMTDAFARVDMAGRIQEANHVYQSMLGYSEEELRRLTYIDLTPEKWHALEASIIEEQVLGQGHSRVYEKEYRKKDGMIFPVELRTFLLRDDLGQTVGMWAIVRDITERKRAEEALRKSEREYRSVIENIQDVFYRSDINGRFIMGSPSGVKMFGYDSMEEMIGLPLESLWADPKERAPALAKMKESGSVRDLEAVLKRKDGTIFNALFDTHFYYDDQGNLLGTEGMIRDITERKRAEEALRDSENRYRRLVELSPEMIAVHLNERYIYVNPVGLKLLGVAKPEELIGRSILDIIHPDYWGVIKERNRQIQQEGKEVPLIEEKYLCPDGRILDVEVAAAPFEYQGQSAVIAVVRDITERKRVEAAFKEKTAELDRFFSLALDLLCIANTDGYFQRLNRAWENVLGYRTEDLEGKKFLDLVHPGDIPATLEAVAELSRGKEVINLTNRYRCQDGSYRWIEWRSVPYQNKLIYAAARDITERKRAEDDLKETEERYRALFDGSPDCVYIHDFNGNFIAANSAALRLFGYERDEILSLNFSALAKPDQLSKAFKTFSELRQTGTQKQITDLTLMRKDGCCVDVEAVGSVIFHEGKPYAIQGVARDITERKKAEEALRKSEEEAKRLAQETTIMAEMAKIISSTLNIEEVYEHFVAEVRKLIPFDLISINVVDPGKRKFKVAYISGVDVGGRRSGDSVSLAETFTGEVIRTRSCLVVNPESMKDLIKRFRGYLPTYQAGLRSLIAVPLFSRNDVVGVMTLSSIGSICYGERELRLAEKVGNQISGAIANALIFAELKRVEEELRMAQLALEARVQERTAELMKINKELQAEIIERKHTEELLKKAKEAAEASSIAKSAFLANMSHELRTPLNAIIGFSQLMADEQAGGLIETQKEYTEDVLRSSRHLLSLINDILDLSKVETGKLHLEVGEVFLPALLQNSFNTIKEESMKHGIQLRMEIDGILERIRGNEQKLKQILYNLLSNAVKFTPDGGVVTLGACRLFFQDRQWTRGDGSRELVPFAPSSSGEWVGISVRDTGIGLKKEDINRIFDPFEQADNSPSRQYQGTGLGLALTRKLVELHGGKIWAESEGPGKGSLFRFLIPLNP